MAELIKGDIVKAVEQIDATVEDVLSGSIATPLNQSLSLVGGMIVNLQDIPRAGMARMVIAPFLPRTEQRPSGTLRLRPQLTSISDIEDLDRWSPTELLSVLSQKMVEDETRQLEALRLYLFHERGPGQKPGLLPKLIKEGMQPPRQWLTPASVS